MAKHVKTYVLEKYSSCNGIKEIVGVFSSNKRAIELGVKKHLIENGLNFNEKYWRQESVGTGEYDCHDVLDYDLQITTFILDPSYVETANNFRY